MPRPYHIQPKGKAGGSRVNIRGRRAGQRVATPRRPATIGHTTRNTIVADRLLRESRREKASQREHELEMASRSGAAQIATAGIQRGERIPGAEAAMGGRKKKRPIPRRERLIYDVRMPDKGKGKYITREQSAEIGQRQARRVTAGKRARGVQSRLTYQERAGGPRIDERFDRGMRGYGGGEGVPDKATAEQYGRVLKTALGMGQATKIRGLEGLRANLQRRRDELAQYSNQPQPAAQPAAPAQPAPQPTAQPAPQPRGMDPREPIYPAVPPTAPAQAVAPAPTAPAQPAPPTTTTPTTTATTSTGVVQPSGFGVTQGVSPAQPGPVSPAGLIQPPVYPGPDPTLATPPAGAPPAAPTQPVPGAMGPAPVTTPAPALAPGPPPVAPPVVTPPPAAPGMYQPQPSWNWSTGQWETQPPRPDAYQYQPDPATQQAQQQLEAARRQDVLDEQAHQRAMTAIPQTPSRELSPLPSDVPARTWADPRREELSKSIDEYTKRIAQLQADQARQPQIAAAEAGQRYQVRPQAKEPPVPKTPITQGIVGRALPRPGVGAAGGGFGPSTKMAPSPQEQLIGIGVRREERTFTAEQLASVTEKMPEVPSYATDRVIWTPNLPDNAQAAREALASAKRQLDNPPHGMTRAEVAKEIAAHPSFAHLQQSIKNLGKLKKQDPLGAHQKDMDALIAAYQAMYDLVQGKIILAKKPPPRTQPR